MKSFDVLSVTQLNRYVKALLDGQPQLSEIFIKGELSGVSRHYKSGHCYFTLKDDSASIRCVMFASSASHLQFEPQDGLRVIVRGNVSIYERDGQYQLTTYDMQPDGLGGVYLAFQQLKAKLEAQGIFAPDAKKPLPFMPITIGVATSPTGAAYHDIIQILARRYPLATIKFCPISVQGEGAPKEICAAIRRLDGNCDVMIIGRGGGSVQDLWCWNDEQVALAVFACKTPIISAVGHETDYSICDFAADLRAPTPSAAAELVAPELSQLRGHLLALQQQLKNRQDMQFSLYKNRILTAKYKLYAKSPYNLLKQNRQKLNYLLKLIQMSRQRIYKEKTATLARLGGDLSRLNPVALLGRGYSISTLQQTGQAVTSVAQVQVGDMISVRVKDGVLHTQVQGKDKK